MTRTQIIGIRDQLRDNSGAILAGGSVIVRAAGTVRPVKTFSDALGATMNPNPVPISGSGRCNIWVDQPVDIVLQDENGAAVVTELNLNPANVVQGFDSGFIANGGFELDSNADGVPDGWTSENNASGSNNGLETGTANVASGTQSWRTQSNGSGGGELVTDRFDVNDVDNLVVRFRHRSTVAAVRNIVRVEWSDVTDTPISNTTILDTTANPATFASTVITATPPSGARLARVRILGGTTGGTRAGITYWDNFRVEVPVVFTGVFGNLLLSGNTLSSTNPNGIIRIDPDGRGVIELHGETVLTGGLSVSSLTTLATLVVSGTSTLNGPLDARGNATVTGTLGVTDATTLTSMTASSGVFSGALRADLVAPVDLTGTLAALTVAPTTGRHLEFDGTTVQGKVGPSTNGLLQLNPLGGTITVGGTTGQDVTLRNLRTVVDAGQAAALTVQNRTDGDPAAGATQNCLLTLATARGRDRAQIGFVNSSSMVFRSLNHGGSVFLQSEDNGGTVRTIIRGDPDGSTMLGHRGVTNIQTRRHSEASAVTGGQVRRRDNVLVDIGPAYMQVITVTSSFALSVNDVNRLVRWTATNAITITFPDDANIPIGGSGLLHNRRSSAVSYAVATGVSVSFSNGFAARLQSGNTIVRWIKHGSTAYTVYQVS